ncbi:MAG TPA: hypothetical protein VFW28_06640 [Micropepsaceae bacterium]|nr:hypothetical protein [Micropepsaceae bacterium]
MARHFEGREMVNNPDPVVRWRNRAEELRTFADSAKDPTNREALRDWAREYERMIAMAVKVPPPD